VKNLIATADSGRLASTLTTSAEYFIQLSFFKGILIRTSSVLPI
jgi:hypothetical protein